MFHLLNAQALGFLFFAALIAGAFDAIAGGGGLLTVPALLLAGLDPVSAIATNKLQGSFGSASSTLSFSRHRLINWKERALWTIVLLCGSSAVCGALLVRFLPKTFLNAFVPILLMFVAIYFLTSKKMIDTDMKGRMSINTFAFTAAPLIGFYDGVFGPGAGAFYMVGFVSLLGFGITKATANTKVANLASNLGGLGIYVATGSVVWIAGLIMALGAFIGARLGVYFAMRLGVRVIKPLLVVISCTMALRLLINPDNPINRLVSLWLR